MKKFKKLLSLMLALVMVLGLGAITTMADATSLATPSFFASSGDRNGAQLSVSSDKTNRSYTAYQILYAETYSATAGVESLGTVHWGVSVVHDNVNLVSSIISALKADTTLKAQEGTGDHFFSGITDNAQSNYSSVTASEFAACLHKMAATSYTEEKKDGATDDQMKRFAQIVGDIVSATSAGQTEGKTMKTIADSHTEMSGTSPTRYRYNFGENVAFGYYIVDENVVSGTTQTSYSRYMVNLNGEKLITAKSDEGGSVPEADKKATKVGETDLSSVSYLDVGIGDTVEFTITAPLPDMTAYKNYKYVINDTMSTGLTFNEIKSITLVDTDNNDSVISTLYNRVTNTSSTDTKYYFLDARYGTGGTQYYNMDGNGTSGYKNTDMTDTKTSNITKEVNGDTSLSFVFHELKQYQTNGYDKTHALLIKYTGTVNQYVKTNLVDSTKNQIDIDYSNAPNEDYTGDRFDNNDPKGTTTVDPDENEVELYSLNLQVKKTGTGGYSLAGAEFSLTGDFATTNQVLVYKETFDVKANQEWKNEVTFVKNAHGAYETSTNNLEGGMDGSNVLNLEAKQPKVYSDSSGTTQADVLYSSLKGDENDKYVKVVDNGNNITTTKAINALTNEDKTKLTDVWQPVYVKGTPSTTLMGTGQTKTTVKDFVSDRGIIQFKGLKAGTYTLTETIEPNGYEKLESPITIKVELVAPFSGATGANAYPHWKITVTNPNVTSQSDTIEVKVKQNGNTYVQDKEALITVVNNRGASLPTTGGIGTTIFYIVGAILVVGGVIVLVVRRRMKNEQM